MITIYTSIFEKNYINENATFNKKFHTFNHEDWTCFSGAEKLSSGRGPYIAYMDDGSVIIVAGSNDHGGPNINVYNTDGDRGFMLEGGTVEKVKSLAVMIYDHLSKSGNIEVTAKKFRMSRLL